MILQAGGLLRELGGMLCAAVVLGAVVLLLLWVMRRPAATGPRTTCRRCGYDVRQAPDRCPECGGTVPDEIRLRFDLLQGRPPAFLLDDEHALPMRQPDDHERFRPLAILQDKALHDRLVTLLRRAGVPSESDFQLMPPRPRRSFQPFPADDTRPRFQVSVPEADHSVAVELLEHVRREGGGTPEPVAGGP